MKNTTLCYIERGDSYLMLHRVKEKDDPNRDKWIGVGGHMEEGESPYDCILREIREETGFELSPSEVDYRGLVTFVSDEYESEQMHLFKVTKSVGEPIDCDEGELEWITKEKLMSLPMWEGDRIFLELIDTECPFFSLRLNYSGDKLTAHELNYVGEPREVEADKSLKLDERKKESLLISACLLGTACRYDGKSKPLEQRLIEALAERYTLVPICPEQLGGLNTPRLPCELCDGRVLRSDRADMTAEYSRGASEALRIAELLKIKKALLKAKSPSCGSGRIYDGSFSGRLTDGDGITAALFKKNGIKVYNEDDTDQML